MTTQAVSKVTIEATPAEVFVYFKELRRHLLWNPPLIKTDPSSLDLKQGSHYVTFSNILGVDIENHCTVSKFVNPKEIEIKSEGRVIVATAQYSLAPAKNGKTIVTTKVKVDVNGPALSLAAPVLQKMARRELQNDLQALKIAVENKISR